MSEKEHMIEQQPLTSENINIILPVLLKARMDMEDVKKDSLNPFHKSKYASLGSFINACDEALANYGLIIFQCLQGNTLVTTLAHAESGQWIRSYAPLLNAKGDSQGLGSSITYMRRYSMAAILNLTAEDDDDGQKSCEKPKPPQQPNKQPPQTQQTQQPPVKPKMLPSHLAEILALKNRMPEQALKNIENQFIQKFGTEKYNELPEEAYTRLKSAFENIITMNKQMVAHNENN